MVLFMVWGGDEGIGVVVLMLLLMLLLLAVACVLLLAPLGVAWWLPKFVVLAAQEEDSASTSEEVLGRCDRIDCLRYIGGVSAGAGKSCGEDETETKSEA